MSICKTKDLKGRNPFKSRFFIGQAKSAVLQICHLHFVAVFLQYFQGAQIAVRTQEEVNGVVSAYGENADFRQGENLGQIEQYAYHLLIYGRSYAYGAPTAVACGNVAYDFVIGTDNGAAFARNREKSRAEFV